ncbi:unnamed protein product [Haemonchus placei]|uniref:G_PROTEIN_RECEP_F1_2 domain-containing protein n=1 Tax=Haemonchus placei TaxID=6290 RepID=A0A0N4X8U9_HAEPC|nr:unnamed protein product [Haemonchus placei]
MRDQEHQVPISYTGTVYLQVLTLQSCTPLLLIAMIIMYTIGQLQLFSHPILEHLSQTVIAFLPLCNPIISLTYITPYRKVVVEWFEPVTRKYSYQSAGSTGSIL